MEPLEFSIPPKVIYEITCVSGNPFQHHYDDSRDFRICTWGYYFNREDAEKVIEENQTDISELGYYRYALLTEKGEGPLAIGLGLQWYEFIWDFPCKGWDYTPKLKEVKKIEMPDVYKNGPVQYFIMKDNL